MEKSIVFFNIKFEKIIEMYVYAYADLIKSSLNKHINQNFIKIRGYLAKEVSIPMYL